MKMLKTKCECCNRDTALWVVFDSIAICQICKMDTIYAMQHIGFGLSRAHPFLDEFAGVRGVHWHPL